MKYNVKLLQTEQTYEFDTEYVDAKLFKLIQQAINNQHFSSREFEMLDVGGGNGKYVDRFLFNFPNANCTIVEPEQYLLDKNIRNRRKTLVAGTFQDLPKNKTFDAIQFNWVLHHFISDSYAKSCRLQLEGLNQAYDLLNPGGIVMIFENFYRGTLADDSASRVIYELTASRMLKYLTEKLGANTAGVGVCFHSENYWLEQLTEADFVDIDATHCYHFGNLNKLKQYILTIGEQRVGFILAKKPED